LCRAPQNKVVFGAGLFRGKQAIICSLNARHPCTVL
jgi:hypothetical protein